MDYFKRVSIVLALIFTFAYLAMSESVRFTTSKQVIVDDISGGASSSSSGSITGAIYVGSMTSFGTITSTTGLRAGTIAASSAAFTVVGNAGLVVSSSAYLATVGGNVGIPFAPVRPVPADIDEVVWHDPSATPGKNTLSLVH